MAKRNNVDIEFAWIHFEATHPRADAFIAAADAWVAERLPNVQLSINENVTHTEALVKIVGDVQAFLNSLPGAVRNAIIRTYIEAEHDLVVALVSSVTWTGVIPPGA